MEMEQSDSALLSAQRARAFLWGVRAALTEISEEIELRGLGRELGPCIFAAELFLDLAEADRRAFLQREATAGSA